MVEYTGAAIRELSGRELRVAVHRLVLGDDLTANTTERKAKALSDFLRDGVPYGIRSQWTQEEVEAYVASWRAEPMEMPLDWCVPELMGPGKVLHGYNLACNSDGEWRCWRMYAHTAGADDPATAIQRAACIVALRKGE